ncbi:type II toxin-antitoxin system HicB family antitoxin [Beijerinckia sp. L45]|uniref:type II toxin-antitoxin system HicB family antitoxin n=1 Tax=Beijerinckia sp. L45 TaxID=1641855 RepID=UPI00131CE198|nr:type II toxin-antitoxin system HicB family antitoxin [Beijerinckia sp. L45]
MRTFAYPAVFEPGENANVIVVTFPDVPEAISQGDGEADARAMGSDALGVALLGLLSVDRPLPIASKPRPGQIVLSVDADIAAKIAVIEAFKAAQITQTELAKRLGKDAKEVRRILDPDHATKMPALVAALAALGRRLVIGVEAA